MKRLIVAMVAAGGLAVGVAAAGPAQATVRPHTTPAPTLVMQKAANLHGQEADLITGANWPDGGKVILAQCNSDGAIPVFAANGCVIVTEVTASSTGVISDKLRLEAEGELAPKGTTPTLSECPQTQVQESDAVQCIFAADDTTSKQTAFTPIFYVFPTPKITWKKYKKIKGVETYSLTVSLSGAYDPTTVGGTVNNGGFEVIGSYTSDGKTTYGECQGTTVPGDSWGVGLPACNGKIGEKVEVLLQKKELGTTTVRTSNTIAGDIDHTFNGVKGGIYKVTLKGEESGQVYAVKVDIK
ncbi:MAG: hypothetical protein ACLPQS_05800 [Acidimicrobiales bacterium]|jgi:hypothetical protein